MSVKSLKEIQRMFQKSFPILFLAKDAKGSGKEKERSVFTINFM